jgi:creatinine amidohydrolase
VRDRIIETPTAHADEEETSLYLYLDAERVKMDKAVREFDELPSEFFKRGGASPVSMMEWWSAQTTSGVLGDATRATVEKGKAIFEAEVEGMIRLIKELRSRPIRPRRDQHDRTNAPAQ